MATRQVQTARAQIQAAQQQAAAAREQARMAAQQAIEAARQAQGAGTTVPPPPMTPIYYRPSEPSAGLILAALAIIFIGFPLAIAFARRLMRGAPQVSPDALRDQSARLARVEQSLDAVAIEIERISEGQRFMTKLMTEQRPELVAAAQEARSPGSDGLKLRSQANQSVRENG